MNKFTIKLFATLRERAHTAELTREFPDGTTVGEIWQRLDTEFPELGGHRDSVRFAVNQEYVEDDYQVRAPAMRSRSFRRSAAASTMPAYVGPITIGRDPIDVAALEKAVADPAAGAIVSFSGTTAAKTSDASRASPRVRSLRADGAVGNSQARRRSRPRWEITRIAIAHRIGVVEIGETSVAIAVSAPHRAEAFEACRFAIDRLKEIVPIWKKEHFEGGEVWIGCQTSHPPRWNKWILHTYFDRALRLSRRTLTYRPKCDDILSREVRAR